MNRIFSLIWSVRLGQLVVASEHARRAGKSPRPGSARAARRKFAFLDEKLALIAALAAGLVFSAPVSAQVAIPGGTNIGAYLNANLSGVNNNFILSGNANWSSYVPQTAPRSLLTLNGAGNVITIGSIDGPILGPVAGVTPTTATISNANFRGIPADVWPVFYYNVNGVTSNVNLNDVTFSNFVGGAGGEGSVFYMGVSTPTSSFVNITAGGGNGINFFNNTGAGDAGGVIGMYAGTVNFYGPVAFNTNTTDNYGGAISMYQAQGVLNFNGPTSFTGNHSVNYFGGAIDIWGGASTLTFNGATTFTGNYVSSPQTGAGDPRGGAINIGYTSPGAGASIVQFNNTVTFDGNYVNSTGTNGNARGGAISAFGNGVAYDYRYIFTAPAIFRNNYAVKTGGGIGGGFGGAIFYDSAAASVSLASGTQFLNNLASTSGGAIYLQAGTISLNATTDNILFQGNRQGVTVSGGLPVAGSGTPNAIYLGSSGTLNLNASAGQQIQFYDPIGSIAGSTVTVAKTGNGEVVFHGDNGATTQYDSTMQANTSVQGGAFTLAEGVNYGNTAGGTFLVTTGSGTAGTVRGGANSQLRAQTITVANGGTASVTGGTFTLNAPTINFQTGAHFGGTGILAATNNIGLAGTVIGNVAAGNELNVSGRFTGTGGLSVQGGGTLLLSNATNAYTGATAVAAGSTLVGGVANAFATSSGVTVDGVLDLGRNNLNQTAGNLAGGGSILLGSATLTGASSIASTYSGSIAGTGSFTKTGVGNLTLSGTSTYSGGTTNQAGGTLTVTNGNALGTGTVANSGVLGLNFAADGTFANQLTGTGALVKNGAGTATLTAPNSTAGAINSNSGILDFGQNGVFSATSLGTGNGATTQIGANSRLVLSGALTQVSAATLNVNVGASNPPLITANSALLSGALNVSGFAGVLPSSASALPSTAYTVIRTTGGGIIGNFTSFTASGSANPYDFVSTVGQLSGADYNVGFGLTWLAGATNGDGSFTLPNLADTFNVDVALTNQAASATGWNGQTLTKNGAGTLVLSANNTYTGPTTISAGTLQVGNGGTTGSITGNVTNNGTLAFNRSDALTYAGVISGGGSVTTLGSGTTTLTGANTYTGGTTISAGTLQIGNNGTTGSIVGNVIDNGILAFNRSDAFTYSGAISGTGSVTKLGGSITTFTGANTYTGGTTISAGTLQLGNGGTTGSITGNVANSGTLDFNRSDTLTFGGVMSGTGRLTQSGTGTTILTNTNTYTGGTTINAGTLQLGNGGGGGAIVGDITNNGTLAFNWSGNISFSRIVSGTGNVSKVGTGTLTLTGNSTYTGTTTINAGTLRIGAGGTVGAIVGNVVNGSALIFNRSDATTFAGAISGSGSVTKQGAATTTFTGDSTYTGGTTISAGTLQLGNGGATGSITGDVANSGTLAFNRSGAVTFGGIVSGTGALSQVGAGTTLLTNANTYTGGTTISAGTLQVGAGGTVGSIVGNVTDNGTLAFNRSDALTFAGAISGAGILNQIGAGTTRLTGNSGSFAGATNVSNGTLLVDGTLGSAVSTLAVSNGATLGGRGSIGGNVSITNGSLSPGGSVGTLTIAGDLALASTSILDYELGQAGVVGGAFNDVTVVGGNLTLDGTLNVTTSSGGNFGPGLYRLISYGGTLTNNGLALGTAPAGTTSFVQTGFAGQVNLVNTTGLTLNYWDGTGPKFDGVVNGGNGVWQGPSGNDNWTDDAGTVNAPYTQGAFAIFAGAPGTVTIDNSLGAVSSSGMQFAVSGYQIQGPSLDLVAGSNIVRVGDGTGAGASYVATIGAQLQGAGALDKTDLGTLVLTAANTHAGGTTISQGTLQLGDGGASGSITGDVLDNGALVFNRSDALTMAGIISGSGSVTQAGSGTTILTGIHTYTGGTTISAGTLQLGDGTTLGSISGDVLDNGTLAIDHSSSLDLAGVISGSGALTHLGSGTTTLLGENTYTGGTTLSDGLLQIGNGGTTGSIIGNVLNNAAMNFNRSNALAFGGTISGSGAVVQGGDGSTTLTGTNTYTGGTVIASGTLQLGAGGTTGSIVGDVDNSGTLDFNRSNAVTFAGVISGTGAVAQVGAGTTTLTADNTYSGLTTISAGTLQLGSNGTTGSIAGDVLDNATLAFNRSNAMTYGGTISGSGAVTQIGAGTTTLTGASTYTGGTTISAGTLQIGAGGTSGSIAGDALNNAVLAFNRSDLLTFGGAISGAGIIDQVGTGTTLLSGNSAGFSGTTNVSNGTLQVDGTLGSAASNLAVSNGGTLGGHGTLGGNVAITDGNLAPGGSPGTLTIGGNLSLTSASTLNYEFGQAGVVGGALNDLTDVGGNLTLDGTLNVTTSAGGSFGAGLYRIINYSGALTDNGLVVGTAPSSSYFVQTSVANQVNLINTSGLTLGYWDGTAGPKNNNAINGGSGVWQSSAGNDNWTTSDGAVNASFSDAAFAVFTAAPGTVTVDNSQGAVTASGMQFASSGYVLQGDPIALVETDAGTPGITTLRVGDGTVSSASYVAAIGSALSGAVEVDKTDLGTLVLSGANSYTGGTRISGGILSVGADANLGAAAGGVTLSGGTLATTASFTSGRAITIASANGTLQTDAGVTLTETGGIDGAGALNKSGTGTLVLTTANTYGGGTTIAAGTLQLGNGVAVGSIIGDVVDNGTLVFDNPGTTTFAGAISGTGAVQQISTGTTVLTAASSYTGGTTISAGTLQLGNGGTTGSILGNVTDNGTLAFDRSDALSFAGVISGSGAVTQIGTGTTTLTGANTYAGGTTISAGAVSVGADTNLGAASGAVTLDGGTLEASASFSSSRAIAITSNNGSIQTDAAVTLTGTGAINGAGGLTKSGAGTLLLTATNAYAGGTTISGGTLQLGNGVAVGSIIGDVTDNGTLAFNNPGTTTFAGVISGTGTVGQLGGTTVLTAASTYSGGTTISGGTLQLGAGGSTGAIVGDVVDNGILAFNRSDALSFAGTISGSGALQQLGGGTTTLTGSNSYAGGTTISAGTLQIGAGGSTGSIIGNIANNAALVFNRSDALAYAGTITGSGSLTQVGGGTTTLSGSGSSVGSVNVSAGTLDFTQAGAFTTSGGYTTASGATTQLAANATLAVGGTFTQAGGSTLNVVLGSAQPVIAAATADLGGALTITGFSGTAPNSASALTSALFNVIHTANPGGISNDFSSVSLGGASSPVDYLTLSGSKSVNAQDYNVGFGLTWLAGATTGNGEFTLAGAADTFNVDVVLANQGASATGWDGTTLTKSGAGTLLLSAANTYTGATAINAGTLRTGIANAFATSSAVNVAGSATLDLNNFNQVANNLAGAGNVALGSAALTVNDTVDTAFGGVISGSGSLVKVGAGALSLTGANTYTGVTTISAGSLQIGDGGTSGSIVGDVVDNAALAFNRSDAITYAGAISGAGALAQIGTGTTLLTGNSSAFSGATSVSNGTLRVDGTLGNAASTLTVASGGTLAGHGTLGGNVSISDGILAPGSSPGTLTIGGNLTLDSTSTLNYEFGQAGVVGGVLNDLTAVNGNLTLDGTLNVAVSSSGNFGAGLYRVISYGGALTNNGLALGAMPAGSTTFVQTGFAGQVNLVNTAGLTLNYWDGTGPKFNSVVNGGNGVWQAASGNDNWADSTGVVNAGYTDAAFSIFAGAPGTVTVDNSLGAITSSGMQFATHGYVVQGAPITLLAGSDAIRVGDGSGAGAGHVATIASELTGAGGVDKTDLGTLVLTGANTYTGGTTISGGTLRLGDGVATGSIIGDVLDNGTLAFNNPGTTTFAGVISGAGTVNQLAGTTVLTAANTYSGGTTIASGGTLQLGDGTTAGSIVGNVADNGTLAFDNPGTTTFAGTISGTGTVEQMVGTTVLTAANTYSGGTTIASGGTLQLGDGTTAGSIVGNIGNSGALVIDNPGATHLAGTITGTGSLTQAGAGTTMLTGAGSSVGDANVTAGTLQLAQAGGFITTGNYTTAAGATTRIAADSSLAVGGVFTQTAGSTLDAVLGTTQPVIFATTADLGGTLNITGFNVSVPNTASTLTGTLFNVIHTANPGGISNDFTSVSLGGASSPVDYLTLSGGKSVNAQDYNVGFGLTWQAGATTGNGEFTLAGAADSFDVDVVLADQGASATGWDGATLTKDGAGTLTLSAVNSYTGATTINAGTLRTGIANAFASSSAVNIADGATLDMGNFNQIAYNFSGAGNVNLGSATLTVNDTVDTAFNGTISGSGGMIKVGTGTLVLTGTDTHTGGTTIGEGTLQVGDGGTSGNIVGTVIDNGTLAFNRADAITFGGAISGSGALMQIGGGTTTLTGANTYVGGTTISTGALQLGNGGATGSITGDVVDDATLIFNRSDNVGFAGVISGSGVLAQVGAGTTSLTGTNTYAGGTTIAAGTLQLGDGGATGSIIGDVTDNALLAFNRSNALDFAGVISGAGAVVQRGSGTTTLTGANTYSGGTTITAGTLQLGDGGTTGAIVGNVTDNALLAFNRSDAVTFGGVISGAGGVQQVGSGTTTLTSANTYSGGTTITAGTLQIGNGGASGSIVGDVLTNGTLAFNRADDVSFDGVISGAGGIQHVGSGVTLLTANSGGFSGATSVSNGLLRVNGTLGDAGSTVSVATGGTISGHGTFGGSVSIADGALAPGGSAGTLTIGGDLSLAAASNLDYEFGEAGVTGGTRNDLTLVGGNLLLDGTLNVQAPSVGVFSPGLYRIISYGGTLTDNGLGLGALPFSINLYVQTGFAGQVNLVNATGLTLNYWDGEVSPLDGVIDGGSGVWQASAGNQNWADATGNVNAGFSDGAFAVFAGSAGTVTVDGSFGAVTTTGMQFAISGYVVQGDVIELVPGSDPFRVGDGTEAGAGYIATIASALTGSGGVDKIDSGTLVLTGENTYTGGTLISEGILQLGDGGTTGSILGDVVDNATLVFNRSDETTFAGVISGSGAVHQVGAGTTTLTGANAYTGGTIIAAGELQLGNGGSSGSIVGDVLDNGALAFNRADDIFFAGAISGTGTVEKLGSGSTTLLAANTYAGGTTITAGTLVGSAASFGSGAIVDNAALVIDQASDASFANAINGSGSFTKTGAGALNLTGTSALSGPTSVAKGLLAVNGSLSNSAVEVFGGAILGGNGVVGATTVRSDGVVAPGNSIGTLTVNGDFTQVPGSIYQVQVDPNSTASDLVAVSGTATLQSGAVLNVQKVVPGAYSLNSRYTVLTAANGVTGTYSVTGDTAGAFFNLVDSYDANNVYLTPDQIRSFVSAARTPNEIATARGLESLPDGNLLKDAVGLLATDEQARDAFNQLSGEIHASARTQQIEDSRFPREAATDRLRQAFCAVGGTDSGISAQPAGAAAKASSDGDCNPQQSAVWVRGVGSWGSIDTDRNAARSRRSIGGLFTGIDTPVADTWRVGVMTGYSQTSLDVDGRHSSGRSHNYEFGVYGGSQWGNLGLRLGVNYTWQRIDTRRNVSFPGYLDRLTAGYDGSTTQVFGEVGYRIDHGAVQLEPFAALAYVRQSTEDFTERGGVAALTSRNGSVSTTFTTLGARAATTFAVGDTDWTARGMLGWRHAFGDRVLTRSMSLEDSNAFTIAGVPVARDAAVIEFGLDAVVATNALLSLSYTGQLGNGKRDNGLSVNLRWEF